MGSQRYSRLDTYTPAQLNMSARDISTAKDSSWFGVAGCNQLVIRLKYTRAAGSGVSFLVSSSTDGGSTVFTRQSIDLVAGAATSSNVTVTKTANGFNAVIYLDIAGRENENMRLEDVTSTGSPNSSDTATIEVDVGYN
jgi:hypothetical protein